MRAEFFMQSHKWSTAPTAPRPYRGVWLRAQLLGFWSTGSAAPVSTYGIYHGGVCSSCTGCTSHCANAPFGFPPTSARARARARAREKGRGREREMYFIWTTIRYTGCPGTASDAIPAADFMTNFGSTFELVVYRGQFSLPHLLASKSKPGGILDEIRSN